MVGTRPVGGGLLDSAGDAVLSALPPAAGIDRVRPAPRGSACLLGRLARVLRLVRPAARVDAGVSRTLERGALSRIRGDRARSDRRGSRTEAIARGHALLRAGRRGCVVELVRAGRRLVHRSVLRRAGVLAAPRSRAFRARRHLCARRAVGGRHRGADLIARHRRAEAHRGGLPDARNAGRVDDDAVQESRSVREGVRSARAVSFRRRCRVSVLLHAG